MDVMAKIFVVAIFAMCSIVRAVESYSILGFATIGGSSHQASIAHIGLELMKRGHNFTLLLSSEDTASQTRLGREPFSVIKQIKFSGPDDIGTDGWLRRVPRDPEQASQTSKRI